MLTAAAMVEDLVDGLGLGADDYLPKPFEFPVLVARIGALTRRAQPRDPAGARATATSCSTRPSAARTAPARSSSWPRRSSACSSCCSPPRAAASRPRSCSNACGTRPPTRSPRGQDHDQPAARKARRSAGDRHGREVRVPDLSDRRELRRDRQLCLRDARSAYVWRCSTAVLFFVSGAILLALVYGAVARTHGAYSQASSLRRLIHSASLASAARPRWSSLAASGRQPRSALVKVAVRQFDSDQRGADLHACSRSSRDRARDHGGCSRSGSAGCSPGGCCGRCAPSRRRPRDIGHATCTGGSRYNGPDDEFKELGDTFDGLLARLDASFHSQRQFVANASHELRTPLARLKTLAQVALADPDASADRLRSRARAGARLRAAARAADRCSCSRWRAASRGLEHREPVDLTQMTGDALAAAAEEIEHAACSFMRSLRSGPRARATRG